MDKQIYLVRHGKATHNIAYEKYGEDAYIDCINSDSGLVNEGYIQAFNLSENITNVFDDSYRNNDYLIFISPLKRCIITALLIVIPLIKEVLINFTLFCCFNES